MPYLVTKVPHQVTKVPYLVPKVPIVRLQKRPMLPKFPIVVTKVPLSGY